MRNILWRDIERFGPNGQDFSSASASLDYERKYAACDSQTMKSFCRRESFIHTHGWSCPSQKAIVRIQSFLSPKDMIVEVGAGWGLWARLLKDEGFTVKATDALNQNTKHYIGIPEDKEIPYAQFFIDVEQRDNLEAMALYGYYDCLLLIWPPYDTEMAYETLKAFKGIKLSISEKDTAAVPPQIISLLSLEDTSSKKTSPFHDGKDFTIICFCIQEKIGGQKRINLSHASRNW